MTAVNAALNNLKRLESMRKVDRFNPATPTNRASSSWLNRYNNETYKNNNGQYSKKYL